MANILGRAGIDPKWVLDRDSKRVARSARYGKAVGLLGLAVCAMIAALITTIVVKGAGTINWEFLSTGPREGMSAGGIWPMIRGTLLLLAGTLAIALPVGGMAGVFLAEYAGNGRFCRAFRGSIVALAGTPSIIFGLFGLAVFVILFKMGVSLTAGWFTLALFILPPIVLTTETAIRSVPESFFEGAIALGMSRWQALRRVVLPSAMPGILTGVVLNAGRAVGEAPPILFTAGIYYSTARLDLGVDTLKQPVANLAYHLAEGYRQGGAIPEKIIWGTCLTLMSLVLTVNLAAILIRAKRRRSQMW